MKTSGAHSSTAGRRSPLPLILLSVTALAVIAAVVTLIVNDRKASVVYVAPTARATVGATADATAVGVTPGTSSAAAVQPSASPSCVPDKAKSLRQDTQFTATSGATVPFSVSLPADYYRGCRLYTVLYVLHGRDQNNVNFMPEALEMRKAMDAGVLDQAIIVTPDSFSTGRWENSDLGPAEDNFIKFLIPHVEKTYRVEPGASHRLLVGFSMGGHGALRFGLKYPHLFTGVWSVDGAMDYDSAAYLPFVAGKSSSDFHITAVGGQLNGSRVQTVIDRLKKANIVIPYVYRDREHEFPAFVQEDEKAGWPAARFLQQRIGQPV